MHMYLYTACLPTPFLSGTKRWTRTLCSCWYFFVQTCSKNIEPYSVRLNSWYATKMYKYSAISDRIPSLVSCMRKEPDSASILSVIGRVSSVPRRRHNWIFARSSCHPCEQTNKCHAGWLYKRRHPRLAHRETPRQSTILYVYQWKVSNGGVFLRQIHLTQSVCMQMEKWTISQQSYHSW